MKKGIICLSCFCLLSCQNSLEVLFSKQDIGLKPSKIQKQNTELSLDLEAQVEFSETGEFLNVRQMNRQNISLNLSDRIIFSDQKKPASPKGLKKRSKFQTKSDSKFQTKSDSKFQTKSDSRVKISSFCSYEKNQNLNRRFFQEQVIPAYPQSFSIFELVPKELLINNGTNQTFYCSFIFAYKNETGEGFNYYHFLQQAIVPYFRFQKSPGLDLIREMDSGDYLPFGNELIDSTNFHEFLIINKTGGIVNSYDLFCEGSEVVRFPFDLNQSKVFIQLLFADISPDLRGVKMCRIFSKDQENRSRAMSQSFYFDFDGLGTKKQLPFDLKSLKAPVLLNYESGLEYEHQTAISLNSSFYFEDIDFNNYSPFVDIFVDSKCTDLNNSSFDKSYRFPLRKSFPLMAVTPEYLASGIYVNKKKRWQKYIKNFVVKDRYDSDRIERLFSRKDYGIRCRYKIKLQDRFNQNNAKEFYKSYFINWTREGYGVDPIDLNVFYFKESEAPSRLDRPNRQKPLWIKKLFFSLIDDVYQNKLGSLNLNFFDMMEDPFYQSHGVNIDRASMICRSDKGESMVFTWPYAAYMKNATYKNFFLNLEIKKYLRQKKVIVCRILFYEDESLLRYFSEEMKVFYSHTKAENF